MFKCKNWQVSASLLVLATVGTLASNCRAADTFWSDNFDEYKSGANIQSQGSIWQHLYNPNNAAEGVVSTTQAHSGANSLSVTSGWVWGSEWSDSTGTNHGGLITLSWWMYVDTTTNISPTWYIDMLGGNGNVVAAIANQEAGSNITKIDVKTTSGWTEVPSIVNLNNWQQVTMQINFAGSTDTYRLCTTVSPTWTNWLSLGATDTYFGNIQLLGSVNNANTLVYYDDFLGTWSPGDINLDGKVDINDLTVVLANFGKTSGVRWSNGDLNSDGVVDLNDLTIVLANWGNTYSATGAAAASASVVPEPGAIISLAAALAGLLACASRPFWTRKHCQA